MRRELDNENFDFKNVNITEDSYHNFLDYLQEHDSIKEVKHSLPLNSIIITMHRGDRKYDINTPDGVIIDNLFIEDGFVNCNLSTTRWFSTQEEIKKHYPGEYTHKAMTYLVCELENNDSSTYTELIDNNGQFIVRCILDNSVSSMSDINKDNILSVFGYSILDFEIRNNQLYSIDLFFDESVQFTDESVEEFQIDKKRNLIKKYASHEDNTIELPSGEESRANTYMFKDANDTLIESYPTFHLDIPENITDENISCKEIPVKDTDEVFISITDYPPNKSPIESTGDGTTVAIRSGYACSETNTVYVLENKEELYNIFEDKALEDYSYQTKNINFDINGEQDMHSFDILTKN